MGCSEAIGVDVKLLVMCMVSMIATPLLSQRSAGQRIVRADLDVTDGRVDTSEGRLLIDVPEMRAVLRKPTTQSIEVHFTYLGPTQNASKLASGEVRRQFGVKLKAQDPCNLVYVMWRDTPQPTLAVSMKYNPGMRSSSQCRDGGYRTLTPAKWGRLPALQPGSSHILRADIDKQDLHASVDGELMWEGSVPPEAMSFNGPVGLRSDNVRVAFDVLVAR
jgi:hypothetical protein